MMDRRQSVRELMTNIGAEHLCDDEGEVNYALIERLKREIDMQVRSNIQQALKLAEVAHQLAFQIEDPMAHALGLRGKAATLHFSGKYEEAIEFYREAASIYQMQEKPVEAARIARSMIDPLMLLSRYDEALTLADAARETLTAYGDKILLAQLETNIGNIYHRVDQYQQALECYHSARDVFVEANDMSALAMISANCANVYSCLDDFRQAQDAYQRAYELATDQEMELTAARAKYNLGYLQFLKGDYHQALHEWHEGLNRFARLGDERHVALCQLDLAEAYLQLNVPDEAVRMALEARDRFKDLASLYEAAKALTWLGLAYMLQSNLSEAENALLEAQEEFRKEGNDVYLGLLKLYLAEIYLRRNEPGAAVAIATEAQYLFSNLGLKAKTCSAQLVVASGYLGEGNIEKGRELCEEIIPICAEIDAPWIKYQVYELLGDILLRGADSLSAYEHYLNAVTIVEQIRARIRVDEFRGAFFKDKLRVYEKLIRLCLEQGTSEKVAEAFYYLESRKARTLVDLLINELEVTPTTDNDGISDLRERWRRLREDLHWFYGKATLQDTSENTRHLRVDKNVLHEIRLRENALVEIVREAQLKDSDFAFLTNDCGITVSELRAVLSPDEIVVEYYFDSDDLKIFVIDQQNLSVVTSGYNRQALKELVLELKFHFEKFNYGQSYLGKHMDMLRVSTNACLHELYKALFAPIASLIGEERGTKLVFVPFDLLHNVPFHALFDGDNYLLDFFEIAYAPSARLLVHSARKPARPIGGELGRALLFGAADTAAPKISEEINAIQEMFPSSQCFTGNEATLSALADHLPSSDIIHIASHAVFRQDNPMFSAFKLAGQWLNFYDICSLRIPSSLVTLSGCSTGSNQIYAGDEMHGLVRGFLTAGASALVVSLWPVNDPATAKLMIEFYGRLKEGAQPRQALNEAALHVKQQSAHPYYWAPFIFIGHTHC
jgi:tetratricopeptide (TPR) repeat protein